MQSLVDVADDEHNTNTTTPVLVATTLFTVVLGAVIWRSSVHHNLSFSLKSRCAPVVDIAETQLEADEKAKTAARSKERRKRGKDPLKDVLKGNKRTKATLSKLAKALDTHASTTTTPSDYVRAGTSCRSISTASSSRTSDDREDPFLPTSLGRIGSSVSSTSRSVSTASSSHDGDHDDDDDAETPHGRSDDISEFPPPASPTASHSTSTSRSSVPSLVDSVSTSSADTIQTDIMDAEPFEGLGHPKDECLGGSPPKPRNKKSQPAAGPSKRRAPPSGSRPGTPPPQTQLASLRGALEAARLREENARRDLERFGKELEMLRWEREAGRQREAELRAQMQQMQAYMAALFHAPSPVSPMFAYPSPGFYPAPNMHPAFSTSSSPGGSPSSRGRQRTRNVDEDMGVSEMLADAILKRPGAMNLGKREEEEPSSPSPQPKNAPIEELTFPSLYPPQ